MKIEHAQNCILSRFYQSKSEDTIPLIILITVYVVYYSDFILKLTDILSPACPLRCTDHFNTL